MSALGDNEINVTAEVVERARKIKLILMDVDGVLTDGTLFYLPDNNGKPVEFKGFNTQDGLGFHFCNSVGIKTGVISGRESMAVVERARILKMTYVFQGHLEKESIWEQVLKDANLEDDQAVFIGDDFTDVPLMRRSGLGCAVANARTEVRAAAHFVTSRKGGDGAVREIMEVILRAQNHWDGILDKYKLNAAAQCHQ
jgi:3-deoxy-D-manno-octulosonate 8-phosphate phosphatase (KDO 8-P phosphatase)